MAELSNGSAGDPQRLFTIEYPRAVPSTTSLVDLTTSQTSSSRNTATSTIVFDLKLEACAHERLREEPLEYGSALVFLIDSTTPLSTNISLSFVRRDAGENDRIEILQTGQTSALSQDAENRGDNVSWSARTPTCQSRFGVLLRRNFNDSFVGIFKISATDNQRSPLRSTHEAESVLFDPSTTVGGSMIDLNDFERSSQRLLASFNAATGLENSHPSSSALPSLIEDDSTDRGSTLVGDGSSTNTGRHKKSKNAMMYHHKQRHVHIPHHHKDASVRSKVASEHDHEMQLLATGDLEAETWDDPVRYITEHELGFRLFGRHFSWRGVRCIRSVKMKMTHTNDKGEVQEFDSTGHWSMCGMLMHKEQYHDEAHGVALGRYMVVGRLSTRGFVIKEKMFRYTEQDEDQMLQRLHKTIRGVRGMRGIFSLKSLSGFGLYQCDPLAGHHTRPVVTETQRSWLASFYNSYKTRSQGGPEFLWDDWVFKHFNNSSKDPMDGKYSIEILLSWSVLRLSIATSIPVLLSLAVGLWYQTRPADGGGDPTGTAWIIATYIITAGALIIAFLGVATGLEQA